MTLADPRGPEQHDILAVLDEVARGHLLNLLLIQRGLVTEVEDLQALHKRKPGETRAHRDVLGSFGGDFFTEHVIEEVRIRQILGGRLL